MDYEKEIEELGYDQEYMRDDIPYIITYLSPKTFTGRNSFYLKSAIAKGDILLKDISKKRNVDLFPDIYKNNSLTLDDINFLENMRYAELEMIHKGVYPKHPNYYAWGYIAEDGFTMCDGKTNSTPDVNILFSYDNMIKEMSDHNSYPIEICDEVEKVVGLALKIMNFMY